MNWILWKILKIINLVLVVQGVKSRLITWGEHWVFQCCQDICQVGHGVSIICELSRALISWLLLSASHGHSRDTTPSETFEGTQPSLIPDRQWFEGMVPGNYLSFINCSVCVTAINVVVTDLNCYQVSNWPEHWNKPLIQHYWGFDYTGCLLH